MRSTKNNSAKKRLAFFLGATAVAFTGLVFGLGGLSASAETDYCDGFDFCMDIADFNDESGYINLGVVNHDGDQISLYSDGVELHKHTETDEETHENTYYRYLVTDESNPEDTMAFRIFNSRYENTIDSNGATPEQMASNYTLAIMANGEILSVLSSELRGADPENYEPGEYYYFIPEDQKRTLPKRGAVLAVYRNGEVPTNSPATDSSDTDPDDSAKSSDDSIENVNTLDDIVIHIAFFGAAAIALIAFSLAAITVYKKG